MTEAQQLLGWLIFREEISFTNLSHCGSALELGWPVDPTSALGRSEASYL